MKTNFSKEVDLYFGAKAELLKTVGYFADKFGVNIYLVGGIVRDIILGIPNADTDILVEGDAIKFADYLSENLSNFQILKTQQDLHTAKVIFDNSTEIDFASTRTETYPQKGYLPQIEEIGVPIQKDFIRRDFSINTLLLSLNGKSRYELIDLANGVEAIENKTLRVLHDNSFIDDPSRILRYIKFAARFNFQPDKYTKNLMNKYLSGSIFDISISRIKSEFVQTFNLNIPPAAKEFIQNKVYKLINPNITSNIDIELVTKLINKHAQTSPNKWLIYFIIFFYGQDIANFQLTKEEQKIADEVEQLFKVNKENNTEYLCKIKDFSIESIISYAILAHNEEIIKQFEKLSKLKIYLTGDELIKMGYKPSKNFKLIFDSLLTEKINNSIETKEEEKAFVKKNFPIK